MQTSTWLSLSSTFPVISYCFYLFIRFQSFSRCLNFTVIFLTVTSEEVCCYIRNVKSLKSQLFATCVVSSCLLPQFVFHFYRSWNGRRIRVFTQCGGSFHGLNFDYISWHSSPLKNVVFEWKEKKKHDRLACFFKENWWLDCSGS